MVVAYALAGNTNIDLTTEPLGFDDNGQAVYLEDVMPSREEIETYVDKYVTRQLSKMNMLMSFLIARSGMPFLLNKVKIINGIKTLPIFKTHLILML